MTLATAAVLSGGVSGGGQGDLEPAGIVRIAGARVNPDGNDVGFETVTLVNTGRKALSVANWQLVDRNGNAETLPDLTLEGGQFHTLTLTGRGAQLSNRGGEIELRRPDGTREHRVVYSRKQAQRQGRTVLF